MSSAAPVYPAAVDEVGRACRQAQKQHPLLPRHLLFRQLLPPPCPVFVSLSHDAVVAAGRTDLLVAIFPPITITEVVIHAAVLIGKLFVPLG